MATPRAFFGRLLIEWDFVTITWQAVLSTQAVDARDHISVTGPVYNTNGNPLRNRSNSCANCSKMTLS
jgi:hypothetical protein